MINFIRTPVNLKIISRTFLILIVALGTACLSSSDSDPDSDQTPTNDNPQSTPSNQQDTLAAPLELNGDSTLVVAVHSELIKISALNGARTEVLFDGTSGSILSSFPDFRSPVEVVSDIVIASADDNTVNGVDFNTGEYLWELRLGIRQGRTNPSPPICSSTVCFVVGGDHSLYSFNPINGEENWSAPLIPDEEGVGVESRRQPLVTSESIYIPIDYDNGSHRLNVYSRQSGQLQESLQSVNPITRTPRIIDNILLLVGETQLVALDVTTYELLWLSEIFDSLSTPVIAGQTVTVTFSDASGQFSSTGEGIAGFDLTTGVLLWLGEFEANLGQLGAVSDGSVIVAMKPIDVPFQLNRRAHGTPVAIQSSDGGIIWDLNNNFFNTTLPPLAVPGHLFFPNFSAPAELGGFGVKSMNSRTGEVNWTKSDAATSSVITAAPQMVLVHEGEVYRIASHPTLPKQ